VSATNENGLGLFDDTASAAGNFPTSLRGYDRSAVDDYVRSLEAAVVSSRRQAGSLGQQLNSLQAQLTEAKEKQAAGELDYTNLGGRASDILRLAEEQARDVLDHANTDAERIKETARREADQAREEADKAGGDIKSTGIAAIEELRVRGREEARQQVEKAKEEAAALVAAARRQAESLQRAAEHEAQTLRQNAYLDTENLRRGVEREVAEIRQAIATEREQAIGQLRTVHEESVNKTSALLAEATEHHQQAADRLEQDITEAALIRAEAQAEAEQVRLGAVQEAEDRIAAARKQAAAITDRTQQEFAWRKQQLRRETELLGQRKQAVLNQLASLSALAEQTAHSFPDMDDLDDFDQEQGDRTVMMPPAKTPSLPHKDQPQQNQPQQHRAAEPALNPGAGSPKASQTEPGSSADKNQVSDETVVMSAVKPSPAKPVDRGEAKQKAGDNADADDLEMDGDATILVPPSQLPAGTAHLQGGSRPREE
jgi:hypothetical protein